jgi:hypothetical protein
MIKRAKERQTIPRFSVCSTSPSRSIPILKVFEDARRRKLGSNLFPLPSSFAFLAFSDLVLYLSFFLFVAFFAGRRLDSAFRAGIMATNEEETKI